MAELGHSPARSAVGRLCAGDGRVESSAYVAYILASKYWGRGYAQCAVEAMLDHLASTYDVDRYMATVEVETNVQFVCSSGLASPVAARDPVAQRFSATERMFMRS